jgi:hypothetical protein
MSTIKEVAGGVARGVEVEAGVVSVVHDVESEAGVITAACDTRVEVIAIGEGGRIINLGNAGGRTVWGRGLTANLYNMGNQTATGSHGASSGAGGQTTWGRGQTTNLCNGRSDRQAWSSGYLH